MPLHATVVRPAEAVPTLAATIDATRGDARLLGVTVVVPTNQCGVMARRALGRDGGIAGVDMVTLNRLAELIAGPALAGAGRRPLSTPIVDLAVAGVLAERPGRFAPVAGHPNTVIALRDLHRELRAAGPHAAAEIGSSAQGRDAVRISRAVRDRLRAGWYDEADLFETATALLESTDVPGLERVVIHLPRGLDRASTRFARALGERGDVRVVASCNGVDGDRVRTLLDGFGVDAPLPASPAAVPQHIVSTTDADDEVRIAVETLVAAARGSAETAPVPFERMAVLWPTATPYARLVEHQLTFHGIPWNGRSGAGLAERLAPRLLLDLLDLDRRGLRRREVFEFLADLPVRDGDGRPLPTAEWERVSRAAGISRDDDWTPRLARLATRERWSAPATALGAFVDELREALGPRGRRASWWAWADWCDEQLDRWLGRAAVRHLPDVEYRAWESLVTILERLRHLDAVSAPVTRQEVRAVLGAELDDASLRQGRVAAGVTAGSLASATGLDVDVAVVLGAADGTLPPPPRHDPLLADEFRARAGLTTADEWSARLEAGLLDVVATAATTITVPRGDLRATTERAPSRWLDRWSDEVRSTSVGSHTHGIASCAFPVSEPQRRLRDRLRVVRAGVPLDRERLDEMTERGLALRRGRDADRLTPYDGDLSGVTVPTLDELDEAVSPSRLEQWATCPHAYFVRYLLRVSPVEEPDRDLTINAMHRGSLQHEVLERFHRQVIDGHLPPPDASGWSSAHAGVLAGLFDDVADEWEAAGRTGRPATWAGERRRMRRDTLGWLDHDSRHVAVNGSVPIGVEWRFGRDNDVTMALPDGRRLVMQGAVDRVDVCADGRLVVTDHKTGKDSGYRDICADDPTLGGTVFQLPTYAAAAQALAAQMGVDAPGTVRAEYGMLGAGGYRRHGVVFDDEAWTRVLGQLQRVVDGIEAGWFPAQPARPGFRLYVPCWYCEPDGLGTTDQWRRWDRKRHDARIERWFGVPDPGGDDD